MITTGFDSTHAAWVAGSMFIVYVLAAYVYFQYPSLSAITGKLILTKISAKPSIMVNENMQIEFASVGQQTRHLSLSIWITRESPWRDLRPPLVPRGCSLNPTQSLATDSLTWWTTVFISRNHSSRDYSAPSVRIRSIKRSHGSSKYRNCWK